MSESANPTSNREAAVAITGKNRVVLWVMGTLLKIWARTIRITIDDDSRRALGRRDVPISLVIWHNRLFLGAEAVRRYRGGKPFHGLISASKDGAWLVGFFEMVGIKAIRGSSSWGAREAASAMIAVAQAGNDLGITPDGPKGPIYEFKPGGLVLARRAKLPMLLVGMHYGPHKALRSWDRFMIPYPFTRIRLRCEQVLPEELPKKRDEALAFLTNKMTELNGGQ